MPWRLQHQGAITHLTEAPKKLARKCFKLPLQRLSTLHWAAAVVNLHVIDHIHQKTSQDDGGIIGVHCWRLGFSSRFVGIYLLF